jgi:hypothetical protein
MAFSRIDACVETTIILKREGHLLVIQKCNGKLTQTAGQATPRIGLPGPLDYS